MAVTHLDHIELIVNDLEGFARMFEAMGYVETSRSEHHGVSIEFQIPGIDQPIFEIHQVSGEEVVGVNHLAWRVDDVAAAAAELRSKGVDVSDPGLVPATGRTIINGRDPDGWRIQFVDARREEPSE
ncbi:MAG: VOC family protein [Dehalococcoidia bacterium]|jgi:catechol 2,3-dioxygenase-like lactoylglutathione lyase family enzyme|nr:VOC family protein [Dehalococcoidia bacterium]